MGIRRQFAETFLKTIERYPDNIYIFVHLSVDGDCIGAACGLSEVLKALGYASKVAMGEDTPSKMLFLGTNDYVERLSEDSVIEPSLAIAVDCAAGDRMGICGKFFDLSEHKLVIDHHKSVTENSDSYWVVPGASSAAELIYDLALEIADIKGLSRSELISSKAADFMMTGIVTDTGRFAYNNTKPETLKAAGDLMELGAKISPIMYWFFDSKSVAELKLSGLATYNARFDFDGKIASAVVTNEMFGMFGDGHVDIGEVVSRLRDVHGVQVALVFRETEDGKIRVNIRSFDPFDCAEFAEGFGGGGHKNAAGCTVSGRDINEFREEMVRKAGELL